MAFEHASDEASERPPVVVARPATRTEVMRPGELGADELAAWRALQREKPAFASPFLAPEFALAVDHARADARVAVVYDDAGPTGFFAFQIGADRVGSPIGAGICDAQAFVCRSDLDWDTRALLHASGLASWRFDHLHTDQVPFRPFHQTLHHSPFVDLTDGYAGFLTTVRHGSKDLLPQMRRRRRKLAREVGPVVTEWSDSTAEPFHTLLAWKSAQYQATGVWDRFAHPWILAVLEELRATATDGCSGLLATTRAGERLAAVHFGLAGPRSLSWWFPAYNHDLRAYSPGLILLLDLIEQAAERGLSYLDLGRGEHNYKLRVATDHYTVAEGDVTRD